MLNVVLLYIFTIFLFIFYIYLQAKALADPFAYETYIEQRKQEKLEAERRNRITVSIFIPVFKTLIPLCFTRPIP